MRYVVGLFSVLLLLLTIAGIGRAQTAGWAGSGQRYRFPVTFSSGTRELTDKVVEVPVDFGAALTAVGASGTLNEAAIQVTEVSGSTVNDPNVVYQFIKDAGSLTKGTLLVFAKGTTAAGVTRTFHVYFDTVAVTKPALVPVVSYTDVAAYQGHPSYQIVTKNATYMFHKPGGGFASMTDADGKDWITHNTTAGSAGMYRGIPNVIEPEGGFHPGDTRLSSQLLVQGPLKLVIASQTNDGLWAGNYEIFPTYVKFNLTKAAHAYWLLYEGTPGGKLDLDTDYNVRSNGTRSPASASWDADIPGPEWIYFADGAINRSLFMYHLEDDSNVDQYWPMGNGNMTVFGFGRPSMMSTIPGHLVFGLMNIREYEPAKKYIEAVSAVVTGTAGAAEKNDTPATPTVVVSTPTVAVSPTVEPSNTPPAGCTMKIQGDANCDSQIKIDDFAIWRSEFLGTLTTKLADFDVNGTVAIADFARWRTSFLTAP